MSTTTVPLLGLAVRGLGAALPGTRISNDDMAAHLATDDAWIRERTGIAARRVATDAETTTVLASRAAESALGDAGVSPAEVDLIIVATSTPDSPCPSTAARLARQLGCSAGSFDLNSACSGFAAALHAAAALLASEPGTALVVGADRYSRVVNPADRSTAVLFGDGAGAAVVSQVPVGPGSPGVLAADAGTDPAVLESVEVPVGADFLHMDGPALFRSAVRGLAASAKRTLAAAGVRPAELDLYVPHQANARIIEAVASRLGLQSDQVVCDVAERANTSAASIPLALHGARGELSGGATVLLSGIGAGLAWSSLLLRWGP